MKSKYDELLNKYLDNELDPAELAEFSQLIENDDEAVKSLKAMKAIEQSVRKIEFEPAPGNVTYDVMKKIASVNKVKRSNWFFWLVVSVFLIGIAAVTFYSIQSYKPSAEGMGAEKTITAVKDFFGEKTQSINSVLKSPDIKLIGTVLTLLFLITGYFVFESHRNLRNKLKRL